MPPCGALVLAWALISTGVLGGRRASTSLPDAPNLPFDCHLARRPLFGVRGGVGECGARVHGCTAAFRTPGGATNPCVAQASPR